MYFVMDILPSSVGSFNWTSIWPNEPSGLSDNTTILLYLCSIDLGFIPNSILLFLNSLLFATVYNSCSLL